MFTVTLFMIAKRWKQLKWTSIDEWISEMFYIYVNSAIKRNAIYINATT